ncbi:hypothetical protein [Caballeronia sp. GAFFF1]|uniref:hypothetical protein n=1 Tax=Caballeronia sp. GAFFF1 TaxID=2921779 RepID=UPI0020279D58|nr:hypothetical protein [Caballeronia sp. GAFFF1]
MSYIAPTKDAPAQLAVSRLARRRGPALRRTSANATPCPQWQALFDDGRAEVLHTAALRQGRVGASR